MASTNGPAKGGEVVSSTSSSLDPSRSPEKAARPAEGSPTRMESSKKESSSSSNKKTIIVVGGGGEDDTATATATGPKATTTPPRPSFRGAPSSEGEVHFNMGSDRTPRHCNRKAGNNNNGKGNGNGNGNGESGGEGASGGRSRDRQRAKAALSSGDAPHPTSHRIPVHNPATVGVTTTPAGTTGGGPASKQGASGGHAPHHARPRGGSDAGFGGNGLRSGNPYGPPQSGGGYPHVDPRYNPHHDRHLHHPYHGYDPAYHQAYHPPPPYHEMSPDPYGQAAQAAQMHPSGDPRYNPHHPHQIDHARSHPSSGRGQGPPPPSHNGAASERLPPPSLLDPRVDHPRASTDPRYAAQASRHPPPSSSSAWHGGAHGDPYHDIVEGGRHPHHHHRYASHVHPRMHHRHHPRYHNNDYYDSPVHNGGRYAREMGPSGGAGRHHQVPSLLPRDPRVAAPGRRTEPPRHDDDGDTAVVGPTPATRRERGASHDAGGGGSGGSSLRAVSSSFSNEGRSHEGGVARAPEEEEGEGAVVSSAKQGGKQAGMGFKQSPGVVTQGGSVETNGPHPPALTLPDQPSLKSAEDYGDEEASDTSSWKQLQQISSIDREEMLKLQFSKSELTADPGVGSEDGKDLTSAAAATPARASSSLEGLAAAATARSSGEEPLQDSPGDLQAPPSTLSRTSSLSNSPDDGGGERPRDASGTEDDRRFGPEGGGGVLPPLPRAAGPHALRGRRGGRGEGLAVMVRAAGLSPRGSHPPPRCDPRVLRPPPPRSHRPPHPHPSRHGLGPISFQAASIVPQNGAEADGHGGDDSPSASTISTKASMVAATAGMHRGREAAGTGRGGGAFFGKEHPPTPNMKPKHPVHVKKSREGSQQNANSEAGQESDAKRRRLSPGSDGASPPHLPPMTNPGGGGTHHVALDGRIMAQSPADGAGAGSNNSVAAGSHHSQQSLELGAMPSWETAGKPLAGWSVCSGMTGMGSLGNDNVLSAFSFSDHLRTDAGTREEGNGDNVDRGGGATPGDAGSDQDPSPKSILSKVGEKRKSLAPGTHVQFSREAPFGPPSAMELPSLSALPSRKRGHGGMPPPPHDEYYYDYLSRYPPGYDQYHAGGSGGRPPPSSRHGHHPGDRQPYYSPEDDPYYEHYYGHYPPPPPHPYGYPPHSRGGGGRHHRGPPHHPGEYPPHSRGHRGPLDGRAPPPVMNTVHTPPSSGQSHLPPSSRSSFSAAAIHHPVGSSSGHGHHHNPHGHHPHHPHHLPPPISSSQFSHVRGAGGTPGWDKDDDAALMDIMKKFKNPKNWDPIAKKLNRNKSPRDCQERWTRYLKPGSRKGQWTDEEDAIVVDAVQNSIEDPFTRWSDLAQKLPGRVGKQVRDRWVNHLNPAINHLPFSREDDLLLWEGHHVLGKRWVEISSKYFKGTRSENHIKNRWYSASFKKFIAKEFGPDAYERGNEAAGGGSLGGSGRKAVAPVGTGHATRHDGPPPPNPHHSQYIV